MLSTYDQLLFLVSTVAMEAEGEPFEGKLGVAFAIITRAKKRHAGSISDTVLKRWQFSAWNTDSPTRMRLDEIQPGIWADCWKAASAAYFSLVPDPTNGADHYLNEPLTRRIRRDGSLPAWVDNMTKTVVIGKHTFYRDDR